MNQELSDLFCCDECGHVDHILLADYPRLANTLKCTCCQGKPWHNKFERLPYEGSGLVVFNRPFSPVSGSDIALD